MLYSKRQNSKKINFSVRFRISHSCLYIRTVSQSLFVLWRNVLKSTVMRGVTPCSLFSLLPAAVGSAWAFAPGYIWIRVFTGGSLCWPLASWLLGLLNYQSKSRVLSLSRDNVFKRTTLYMRAPQILCELIYCCIGNDAQKWLENIVRKLYKAGRREFKHNLWRSAQN
jgi:hypothetical protein